MKKIFQAFGCGMRAFKESISSYKEEIEPNVNEDINHVNMQIIEDDTALSNKNISDLDSKKSNDNSENISDSVKHQDKDIIKEGLDLDKPEIRFSTSINLESGGYVIGFSIQGRNHIKEKLPCQDYHAFEDLGDGWLIAITSDGAGSARESARGSKANCDLALRLIKQLLESKKWKKDNYLPTDMEWYIEIRNIFEIMQGLIARSSESQVNDYKDEQEKKLFGLEKEYQQAGVNLKQQIFSQIESLKKSIATPLTSRDFNATIILLLITPKGMLTAHIGDGRMGYLSKDGVWKSLMIPHKGEEASSTVFIPNAWNRQYDVPAFKMSDVYLPETHVVNELPKAFVLMSDGCESFSWTCKVYDEKKDFYFDKNEPFDKFLNPLIDYLGKIDDKDNRISNMIEIVNVGTEGGKREMDDRTMLLGVFE